MDMCGQVNFGLESLRKEYEGMHTGAASGLTFARGDFFFLYKGCIADGWSFLRIPSVRIGSPTMIYIHRGSVDVGYNQEERLASAGDVFLLRPGVVMDWRSASADLLFSCLVLDETYIRPLLDDARFQYNYFQNVVRIMRLTDEEREVMVRYMDFMWYLITHTDSCGRALSLQVASVLHYLKSLGNSRYQEVNTPPNRAYEIFNRYLLLVQENSYKERSLEYYADQLSITKKYLCALVKTVSMCTAKEWIDRFVILRAKRMLTNTDKSVAEIADSLNFAHIATFCKLFKRSTGYTPQGYRSKFYYKY